MPGQVQSIARAAAILRLLAGGSGRLGLLEIARALDLPKGTAHGIVRTLQDVGFVEQDKTSGKYQLGAALLHLGTSYLDVNELRSRSINWADPLAARSGEAVRIGTLLDSKVLVVHHVFRPDDTLQTLDVGALLPPHATALGKVLLAYQAGGLATSDPRSEATRTDGAGTPGRRERSERQPAQSRGGGYGDLAPYTRRTLATPRTLARALTAIREAGWGSEIEEMTVGEAGIAAPIRGYGGLVVGAIGISGPVERVCDAHGQPRVALVTQVREAARAVSRDLGGRGV
ncbi:IclR family transcriptional regulator [Phytohabitans sp. LJ34]|uniref:IclR family transcriptional regulator n=1 Tax=Phytohabitans sp. LJ34 TaxID=3452217 RepID=UPI003F892A7D